MALNDVPMRSIGTSPRGGAATFIKDEKARAKSHRHAVHIPLYIHRQQCIEASVRAAKAAHATQAQVDCLLRLRRPSND